MIAKKKLRNLFRAIGSFRATNKRLDMPYCEVVRFDKQGKISEVTAYYDMLTMLAQLGHLQPPREIEAAAPTH